MVWEISGICRGISCCMQGYGKYTIYRRSYYIQKYISIYGILAIILAITPLDYGSNHSYPMVPTIAIPWQQLQQQPQQSNGSNYSNNHSNPMAATIVATIAIHGSNHSSNHSNPMGATIATTIAIQWQQSQQQPQSSMGAIIAATIAIQWE